MGLAASVAERNYRIKIMEKTEFTKRLRDKIQEVIVSKPTEGDNIKVCAGLLIELEKGVLLACNLIDSHAEKMQEVEGLNEILLWYLGTFADIFDYNEYSQIDLDLIARELKLIENLEKPTREMYQKFHLRIIESGLATLPTTEKAIKKYGNRAEKPCVTCGGTGKVQNPNLSLEWKEPCPDCQPEQLEGKDR